MKRKKEEKMQRLAFVSFRGSLDKYASLILLCASALFDGILMKLGLSFRLRKAVLVIFGFKFNVGVGELTNW